MGKLEFFKMGRIQMFEKSVTIMLSTTVIYCDYTIILVVLIEYLYIHFRVWVTRRD